MFIKMQVQRFLQLRSCLGSPQENLADDSRGNENDEDESGSCFEMNHVRKSEMKLWLLSEVKSLTTTELDERDVVRGCDGHDQDD